MKSTATVYKIVIPHSGLNFKSGFTGQYQPLSSGNVLLYRVGFTTLPKFGKIFAFGDLQSAKDCLSDCYNRNHYMLFKAIGTNVVVNKRRIIGYASDEDLKSHWSKKKKGPAFCFSLFSYYITICRGQLPRDGTVTCDSLKLVSEVTI